MLEQYETSINDLTSNNVIVFNIDADNEGIFILNNFGMLFISIKLVYN